MTPLGSLTKICQRSPPGTCRASNSHAPGLQPLLHAGKTPADEGDVMDNAGIRLLWLVGPGNIDQMHHRLALAVHPCAGEREVRPGALLQAQNILIEPDRFGELAGPDVEMIEHAHADAMRFTPFFVKFVGQADPSTKPRPARQTKALPFMAQGLWCGSLLRKPVRPEPAPAHLQNTVRPSRRQNPRLYTWLKSLFSVSA